MNKANMILGWLTGKMIARQRREPVAYLYNGVRLPALPEWDETKYPYAQISGWHVSGALLRVTTFPFKVKNGWFYTSANGSQIAYKIVDNQWEISEANCMAFSEEKQMQMAGMNVEWANYNVLKENGEVYLVASDPIPVNE